MVFATYFLKRFVGFFFALTLLLAGIFNLIEFFEKLVRVEHTNIASIAYFIGLNFFPSFSDLMPIGAWLATCLVIWDFHQHHEWETLFLVNIGYKALLKLFACGSLMIMVFAVIIHENVIVSLSTQAARFKLERFKQGPLGKISNKSYMLQEDLFCSMGSLDLYTYRGNDLLLVYLSPYFDMQKIIKASSFYVDPLTQKLTVIQGHLFDQGDDQSRELHNEIIMVPSLFVRLQMTRDEPSLMSLVKKVIVYNNALSRETRNELLYLILCRFLFYFQIFIYPIATFFLFLVAEDHSHYKWMLLLLPYPLITFFGICMTFLLNYGAPFWFFTGLYLFLAFVVGISGIVFWKKRLVVR